jgi:hypothetical protein
MIVVSIELRRTADGMASKGLYSNVPINRDEKIMRVMNFSFH